MNSILYQQAESSYRSGDWPAALQTYTQCLQDASAGFEAGQVGLLYHRIGNCLMKLHDFDEAIHAYTQATADAAYDGIASVNNNLGNCYAAMRDYEDAVKHFEIAASDRTYATPYKAYSGMGMAYLKLGRTAEAGSAFRSAALDEANPDPAHSLLNLGICFMALKRPADAVASYESALQFHMDAETKNKIYANLGQAYTATGKMQQAVDSFERALADKTYFLNDAASVDYQRAVGAVAQGTAVLEPVAAKNDLSGLDVPADGAPQYQDDAAYAAPGPYGGYGEPDAAQGGYGAAGDERFFTASDEELEQWSRGVARQDRKRRNVGLKILVAIIIVLAVLLIGGIVAYTQGFGLPAQEAVAAQLFSSDETAAKAAFASSVSEDDVASMMTAVVQDDSPQVDGMDRSMNSSTVYVTADTEEGGQVHYKIAMVRDNIGWKVSSVDLYFPSQS